MCSIRRVEITAVTSAAHVSGKAPVLMGSGGKKHVVGTEFLFAVSAGV